MGGIPRQPAGQWIFNERQIAFTAACRRVYTTRRHAGGNATIEKTRDEMGHILDEIDALDEDEDIDANELVESISVWWARLNHILAGVSSNYQRPKKRRERP